VKKLIAMSVAVLGTVFTLSLAASPAQAQASRTWVSGVGDDANPCSRTAPCKTFAGSISKTAVNGEINCLDPGGFGAVTITKSITIDCHEVYSSILNAGTNGINIAFDSFAGTDTRKTVNLRNINLQGFDSGLVGIRIFGAGTGSFVNIEDCLINGDFGGGATGISDVRTNGTLNVLNTTVRNMGANGIQIAPNGAGVIKATLSDVRISNSGTGFAGNAGAATMISRSVFSGNLNAGIFTAPSAQTSVDSSVSSLNGQGISGAGTVRVSNSDLFLNGVAVSGTINSFSNNRIVGPVGGTITPIGSTSNPTGQQ
jgi:hypothetical protein